MIENYFKRPHAIRRVRSACTGPHMDAFASALSAWGYSRSRGQELLSGVALLGQWMDDEDLDLASLDQSVLLSFVAEIRKRSSSDDRPEYCRAGGRRFHRWARERSIVAQACSDLPGLLRDFENWMVCHRNLSAVTLKNYRLPLRRFVAATGDDPGRYAAPGIRQFIVDESRRAGRGYTQLVVTAVRSLLRQLAVVGRCAPELVDAVPTIARWRLDTLPQYLEPEEVDRLISACDPATVSGCRDRAMVLLMARLGLRSGDLIQLCLGDIDWSNATIQVSGKGRRAARVPLPQEVGDALLLWITSDPHQSPEEHVFHRLHVPRGPLSNQAMNSVVLRAAQRAGLDRRVGPSMLRHSAATVWLNQGMSLPGVGTLLRHQHLDTTMIYAKVDASLLGSVSQPWPMKVSR